MLFVFKTLVTILNLKPYLVRLVRFEKFSKCRPEPDCRTQCDITRILKQTCFKISVWPGGLEFYRDAY